MFVLQGISDDLVRRVHVGNSVHYFTIDKFPVMHPAKSIQTSLYFNVTRREQFIITDVDGNNAIDQREWAAQYNRFGDEALLSVEAAFAHYDVSEDGIISPEEFPRTALHYCYSST